MRGASTGCLGPLVLVLLGAFTGCLPDAPGLACGADGVTPRCATPGSECRAGYCAVRAADCASGWRFTDTAATPRVCAPATSADAGAVDVQAVDDGVVDDRPALDDAPHEAGADAVTADVGVDAGGSADVAVDLGVVDAGADAADGGLGLDAGVDAGVGLDVALGAPDAGTDGGPLDAGGGDVAATDVPLCPPGESLCAGRCHPLSSSSTHCGACGNRCPLGEVCADGACACGAGQLRCGGVCGPAGPCTSTGAGGCAQSGTRRCVNGALVCDAVPRTSGPCSSPVGGQCGADGQCACPPGRALCGGACIDLRSDRANCGRCGAVCGHSQVCLQGVCAPGCLVRDGSSSVEQPAPRCQPQGVCPPGLVCTGAVGVCLPPSCLMGGACLGIASCVRIMLQVTCGTEVEAVAYAQCQRDDQM